MSNRDEQDVADYLATRDPYDEAVINESADAWLAEALRRVADDHELVESVRREIEDELIEWRDEGRFVANRNGLAIYGRNSEPPHVIRISTAMTIGRVLQLVADRLEHPAPSADDLARVGRPSGDGDATGGGPYTPGPEARTDD